MELTVKHFDQLTTRELYEILQARIAVFVVEQNCPFQEIDGKDFFSYHVFYRDNGQIQAYVRVVEANLGCAEISIGRVLTIARGSGLGRKIMREGIRIAQEILGADKIHLEAQSYAKGFYEQFGFRQISEEFLEDDIPHINMLLKL